MHEAWKNADRVYKDDMEHEAISQGQDRDAARAGRQTRTILAVAGAAFLLGAGLTGYFVWRGDLPLASNVSEETVPVATTEATAEPTQSAPTPSPTASASEAIQAAEAVEAVEMVAQQQGGLDSRVVAMEQRIDQINLQAQAAAGNAARAEALLIAFAARRAIERGAPLGYLADQLKLRFGDARPNAVQTVLEAAQRPVTLDQLLARLDGLTPTLANEAAQKVSWNWFQDELANLFVIRRETSPSPQPERRLERARLFLESGRIEAAVAEIRNLPRADEAASWIADAEEYAAAQRALDLLETTAVLEPRDLRDGTGQRVEQRSPASATSN